MRPGKVAGWVVLVLSAHAPLASAQQHDPASKGNAGMRRLAITAGLGNTFGGLGATAEVFLADARASVVVGGGYLVGLFVPGGGAYAFAARGFWGGENHRVLLEGSWTVLASTESFVLGLPGSGDSEHHYGVGLSVGYRYTGDEGLTFLVAAGQGWARGEFHGIINIGIGFTVRKPTSVSR